MSRTGVASWVLGVCSACSNAGQPIDAGERSLPVEPAQRLTALAARLGKPKKAAIEALGHGFRVSVGSAARGRLDVELDADGAALRVGVSGRSIAVHRVGNASSNLTLEGDSLRQTGPAPGSSALLFALDDCVEELLYVPSRQSDVGYDFELAGGLRLREPPGSPPMLVVDDARGRPWVRVAFGKSWDADGRQWPIQLNLDGQRVRLALPDEARFPVVIDPTWSKTDTLSTPRFRHTATLLLDGKLLLVGGATEVAEGGPGLGRTPSASAELFDPVSGFFEEVGALAHARWGHSATLLHDGRVLIAGGIDEADAALSSAELYDPVTQAFVETRPMNHARALHTATLLADARVLMLGGIDDLTPGPPRPPYARVYEAVVSAAEAYQPRKARFDELGDAPGATFPHAAALLSDGRVGVAWPQLPVREPGSPEPPQSVKLAWFEPQKDQFTAAVELPCTAPCQDLLVHYQAAEPAGESTAPGGPGDANPAPLPERIDIVTAQEEIRFEPVTGNIERADHALAFGDTPQQAAGPTLFDETGSGSSAAMAFGSALGANYNRANDSANVNFGPRAALAGGWRDSGVSDLEALSVPNRNSYGSPRPANWIGAGQLAAARAWPTATSLPSGDMLVTGGVADEPLRSLEELSVASQRVNVGSLANAPGILITQVPKLGDAIVEGHATILLADGSVLFTGGYVESKTAYIWHVGLGSNTDAALVAEAPSTAGDLVAQRAQHRGFLLSSGRVLLAGGETQPERANEELFEPPTRKTQGKSLDLGFRLQARHSGIAAGGTRYLFAGQTGLELVDAGDGAGPADFHTRTIQPPEPLGCTAPALARLLNGRIAVLTQDSIFELDLQQGTASTPVALHTPRCDPALTALPDGTLMIAGGSSEPGVATTTVEVYDPDQRLVSVAANLLNPVAGARAVVRFSNLFLLGGAQKAFPPQLVKWASGAASGPFTNLVVSHDPSVTPLADGSVLVAALAEAPDPAVVDAPERLDFMTSDSTDLDLSRAPLEVTPGTDQPLTDLKLSRTWPENSGGISGSSATNSPVAIWIPLQGNGWPVTGTFSEWSEDRATWHVPHPAFPGLGVLGYVRSGVLHPLRLVRIGELGDGEACVESSECGSSYCVDGVCCDRACDGACEACAASKKASGADGVCGPSPADDTVDEACDQQELKTCGRSGLCDGQGQCALYPEGMSCTPDGANACKQRICTLVDTGSTCSSSSDHEVTDSNGHTTACKNNFRCAVATGVCLLECTTNVDCVDGFLCDAKGQCQEPLRQPNTSIGCAPGCRVASHESPTSEAWMAGLGLVLAASRRHRRRRQSATSRSAL
jgi:Galactose oxidase, central domain